MATNLVEKIENSPRKGVSRRGRNLVIAAVATLGLGLAGYVGYNASQSDQKPTGGYSIKDSSLLERIEAREKELYDEKGFLKGKYEEARKSLEEELKGKGKGYVFIERKDLSWKRKLDEWQEKYNKWEDGKNNLIIKTIYENPREAREYIFSGLSEEDEKELREFDFSVFGKKEIQEMNGNLSEYGIELPLNYKDFSKKDKLLIQYDMSKLMKWQ